MNIPVYIKGSGDTFDIATSEHILNDRQLFYHKQTHQLYIGDGSTKLKDLKPITMKKPESITFTVSNWQEIANSNFYPYQGSANITLDDTIKRIELINNNAELFAQYGFAITTLSTNNIIIGAVENPNTAVTFTCILHYDN